jgi:hypothetical protein
MFRIHLPPAASLHKLLAARELAPAFRAWRGGHRKVTLMGSMNWSSGAAQNSEDLNLVSPEVAGTYAAH